MKINATNNWKVFLIVILWQKLLSTDGKRFLHRKKKYLKQVCLETTCNHEGECHSGIYKGLTCDCYKQYFTGPYCSEITDNCMESKQPCVKENTVGCHSYFGSHFCICKNGFYGRQCQNYGFENISHARNIGLYLPREFAVGNYIPMVISYDSLENTSFIGIDDNVLGFDYNMKKPFIPTYGWRNLEDLLFRLNILNKYVAGELMHYSVSGNYYLNINYFVPLEGRQYFTLYSKMVITYQEHVYKKKSQERTPKEDPILFIVLDTIKSAPLIGLFLASLVKDSSLSNDDPNDTHMQKEEISQIQRTLTVREGYSYEYRAILNQSNCVPQIIYFDGACSPYGDLPAMLLKTRMYSIGVGVLNQCGELNDVKFKHFYLANDGKGEQSKFYNSGTDMSKHFTIVSVNSSVDIGGWYGVLVIADEVQNLKNKNYYYGKRICWFTHHYHPQPFITTNASQQVILSVNDRIYIELSAFSPENIFEKYTGTSLSYTWTCKKISYGFASTDTCVDNLKENGMSTSVYSLKFSSSIEAIITGVVCTSFITKGQPTQHCEGLASVFYAFRTYLPGLGFISETGFPFLVINCLRNCGGGTDKANFLCDYRENVILKGVCKARCHLVDTFSWRVDHFMDDHFFTDEITKYLNEQEGNVSLATSDFVNYVMLKAGVFSPTKTNAVISLTHMDEMDDTLGSIFTLHFWHYSDMNIPNFTPCKQPLSLFGAAYYDDFFICLNNINYFMVCTYMFFQKVSEVDSDFGVLIGSSQVHFLRNVSLAACTDSHIQVMVHNDYFGTTYNDDYYYVDVSPPRERLEHPTHATFLRNVVEGNKNNDKKRPSLNESAKHNAHSVFTQTAHFLIIEFANIRIYDNLEFNLDLIEYKRTIMDLICEHIKKMDIPSTTTAFQMITLMHEIVYIGQLPVHGNIAMAIGTRLATLGEIFHNFVVVDPLLRNRPYKVLRMIEPVFQIFTAITTPAYAALMRNIDDYYILYLFRLTYDELKISDYEEDLEPSELKYEEITDPEYKNIFKKYQVAAIKAAEGLTHFLKALLKTWEPIYDGTHIIYGPSLEFLPTPRNNIYLYVRRDNIQRFNSKLYYSLPKTFPRAEVGSTTSQAVISVAVLILSHIPFWWSPLVPSFLPKIVVILVEITTTDDNERSVPISINYHIEQQYSRYTKSVASQQANAWTCHTFKLGTKTRNLLLISLIDNEDRPNLYEVRVDEDGCPDNTSFILNNNKHGFFEYVSQQLIIDDKTQIWIGVRMLRPDLGEGMYSLSVNSFRCLDWKTISEQMIGEWDTRCEPSTIDFESESIKCQCNLMNLESRYVGVQFLELRNTIVGFMPIDIDYELPPPTATIMLFIILSLIILLLVLIARKLDKRDSRMRKPIFLRSNKEKDKYPYLIIVVTGGSSPKCTTSMVFLKMFGSDHNSKRHTLNDIDPATESSVLNRRTVDYFVATAKQCLGRIRAVEVWIDYTGSHPSWFCEKIVIRDMKYRVEWVFLVNKWFSVAYGEKKIHRILYQTKPDYSKFLDRALCLEDFKVHHVWYGMWVRKPCHPLTRVLKTFCALSMAIVGELFAVILFGCPMLDDDATVEEGEYRFDLMFLNGFWGALIATIFVYPLMYIIKNCGPNPSYNIEYYDFSGVDPSRPVSTYTLPYMCLRLTIAIYLVSVVFIFLYTAALCLSFGPKKLFMVVGTYFVIALLDAVFIETLHVLIRCVVWRGVLRHQEMDIMCNEQISLEGDLLVAPRKRRRVRRQGGKRSLRFAFAALNVKEREAIFNHELNYRKFSRVVDITFVVLFLCLLILVFSILYRDPNSYYGTEVLRNIFLYGRYTKTLPLENITTLNELYSYLNNTFLLGIHWHVPCWLISTNYRLISVVRFRQSRIAPSTTCQLPSFLEEEIEKNGDNSISCSRELGRFNRDHGYYGLHWHDMDSNSSVPQRIRSLFWFTNSEAMKSNQLFTIYNVVPADGYVGILARSFVKSRNDLNAMKKYDWIDGHTRILVIEFSVYNPHANILYIVTLCVELTITGTFIVSNQILPVTLVQQTPPLRFTEIVINIVIVIVALVVIIKKITALFKIIFEKLSYDSVAIIVFDVILASVTIDFALTVIARSAVIEKMIIDIQVTKITEFLSFNEIAYLDHKAKLLMSFITFLMAVRYASVLMSLEEFKKMKDTMLNSLMQLLSVSILFFTMTMMGALLLYLMVGAESLFWWDSFYVYRDIPSMAPFVVMILQIIFNYWFQPLFIVVLMHSCRNSEKIRTIPGVNPTNPYPEFFKRKFCD